MMTRRPAGLALLALLALLGAACGTADDGSSDTAAASDVEAELDEVRAALTDHTDPGSARAAGWTEVDGLDHCFERSGAGAMGYHLIDTDELEDPTLEPTHPEALVYLPDGDGELRLGAVEYIVPTELWDDEQPPELFDRDLHVLEPVPDVEVWALHVWLFEDNPDGTFADWHPEVSCPPETEASAAPGTEGQLLPL